jgi:hypothetical protein
MAHVSWELGSEREKVIRERRSKKGTESRIRKRENSGNTIRGNK